MYVLHTYNIQKNYKIGIIDNHHKSKIDYPSGTALMLANAVAKGKNKNLNDAIKFFKKCCKRNKY